MSETENKAPAPPPPSESSVTSLWSLNKAIWTEECGLERSTLQAGEPWRS